MIISTLCADSAYYNKLYYSSRPDTSRWWLLNSSSHDDNGNKSHWRRFKSTTHWDCTIYDQALPLTTRRRWTLCSRRAAYRELAHCVRGLLWCAAAAPPARRPLLARARPPARRGLGLLWLGLLCWNLSHMALLFGAISRSRDSIVWCRI